MKYVILIICSILLFGCSNNDNKTIALWTNRAEFAAYIEEFNAAQNNYIVELVFLDEPSTAFLRNSETPDIIVSEHINNSGFFPEFESLNSIVNKNRINPDNFYEDLLNLGKNNNNQLLLPINFSLPAVIYQPDSITADFTNMFISFEQLKNESSRYNTLKRNRLTKMGFFPLWEPDFLYYTAVLFNTDFRANQDNSVAWDKDGLLQSINLLKTWTENASDNLNDEISFTSKYLRIPAYQLIQSNIILFYFTDIKNYLEIPKEKREVLDFRWLEYDGKTPVLDNILFAGIPSYADNKSGARAFFEWFFQRDTQVRLMEINHLKRLQGIFGIANGFSSLIEINEKDIHKPEFYPIFVGHIPNDEQLIFPNILPEDWNSSIKEKIMQYLEDILTNSDYKLELAELLE